MAGPRIGHQLDLVARMDFHSLFERHGELRRQAPIAPDAINVAADFRPRRRRRGNQNWQDKPLKSHSASP
jgi:hypothetical protein